MFVISLKYTKELKDVDKYLEEHKDYLKKYFDNNIFIAAGRKVPRDGGIIIAYAESREKLDTILDEDPFKIAGVADYEVQEFVASVVNSNLNEFKDE